MKILKELSRDKGSYKSKKYFKTKGIAPDYVEELVKQEYLTEEEHINKQKREKWYRISPKGYLLVKQLEAVKIAEEAKKITFATLKITIIWLAISIFPLLEIISKLPPVCLGIGLITFLIIYHQVHRLNQVMQT